MAQLNEQFESQIAALRGSAVVSSQIASAARSDQRVDAQIAESSEAAAFDLFLSEGEEVIDVEAGTPLPDVLEQRDGRKTVSVRHERKVSD